MAVIDTNLTSDQNQIKSLVPCSWGADCTLKKHFHQEWIAAFQSVMLCIFTPCRRTALTLLHLLELKAVNLLDDTT
uniref:Uncharacterized protein n=1 Tax=Catharus ustulatus TaxID=91951 RepID=A0A8C3UA87_CATUS